MKVVFRSRGPEPRVVWEGELDVVPRENEQVFVNAEDYTGDWVRAVDWDLRTKTAIVTLDCEADKYEPVGSEPFGAVRPD